MASSSVENAPLDLLLGVRDEREAVGPFVVDLVELTADVFPVTIEGEQEPFVGPLVYGLPVVDEADPLGQFVQLPLGLLAGLGDGENDRRFGHGFRVGAFGAIGQGQEAGQ